MQRESRDQYILRQMREQRKPPKENDAAAALRIVRECQKELIELRKYIERLGINTKQLELDICKKS